jgi:hypothetical protein
VGVPCLGTGGMLGQQYNDGSWAAGAATDLDYSRTTPMVITVIRGFMLTPFTSYVNNPEISW